MAIREKSFRIGCGRYVQEAGALAMTADEVLRLGKSPIVVGGKTALSLTREAIEKSFEGKINKYEIIEHTGTCNEVDAKRIADFAKENGYDVIVGVGGGVICDFSKLCGYYDRLPVMNIPTSSATCASYTPLTVRYTQEGRTVGSLHYEYEVDAVLVDSNIVANQPPRLLLAGVFDALAKFLEIKQRFTPDVTDYPIGLDYAYSLSKSTYKFLVDNTQAALDDIEAGELTHKVENLIFTSIATTGVISGIARGSNQCALAHKFYEFTRLLFPVEARPYLHGEIVGVGLLLQNFFNDEVEENDLLLTLMKKYNMPYRVSDIGADMSKETFEIYYEKLCASSAMEDTNDDDRKKLRAGLEYLWSL